MLGAALTVIISAGGWWLKNVSARINKMETAWGKISAKLDTIQSCSPVGEEKCKLWREQCDREMKHREDAMNEQVARLDEQVERVNKRLEEGNSVMSRLSESIIGFTKEMQEQRRFSVELHKSSVQRDLVFVQAVESAFEAAGIEHAALLRWKELLEKNVNQSIIKAGKDIGDFINGE